MRAIAVLLVVLYHARVPGISGGYVGVDVFFVISGYLITQQLVSEIDRRGRLSFIGFYSRRFRRLLPPIAIVVFSSLLLARFVLPYTQLMAFIKDVYYAAFYGINYHFAVEGVQYQNAAAPPSPLQHFWSLAVEEQFYALWPILLAVCALVGRRRFRRGLMISSIAVLSACTLLLSITITAHNTSLAYFSLQTRAWELGVGALIALTLPQWAIVRPALARLLAWSGLAVIVATAFVYDDHTAYPGIAALAPVLGAGAMIAGGVIHQARSPETVLLERRSMQYIGRSSYAFYLWHWPMLILLPAWVGHPLPLGERLEVLGLAFWFAVLTYFLENACHRSGWRPRSWAATGVVLSGVIALAAAGTALLVPSLATTGKARIAFPLAGADVAQVQRALAESLSIRALPKNLTPTLDQAVTDLPHQPAKCLAGLSATTSPMCVFGDTTATRTAVVLGDSHAQQWMTPLAQAATQSHWRLVEITKAACPIANVQFYEVDIRRKYTECDAFRSWVHGQVARLNPALIVASQSNAAPWNSVTDSQWAQRTVQALTTMGGQNTRIAYIGDSPTTTQNELTCLQRHLSDATSCVYSRAQAFGIFAHRYTILKTALVQGGIGFVDSLNFFCGPASCPSVVQNMVVHRDEGHVTNTYATWLEPMIAPIFEGVGR